MNMSKSARCLAALSCTWWLLACIEVDPELASETETSASKSPDETETGEPTACERVELDGEALFPESAAIDASGRLYVSSAGLGAIARVDPCASTELQIPAGGPLRAATGVAVDPGRNRLLVCDVDLGFMSASSLDVFALDTGELVASHEFAPMAACGDLALDPAGNVYMSDSTTAKVVRVPAAALDEDSPVQSWADDPSFATEPGALGLDGVAHDGDQTLYLSNFTLGVIHEIEIEADGSAGAIRTLELERELALPDGIRWHQGELLVVEAGLGNLVAIDPASSADTIPVELVAAGFDTPTSLAIDGDHAWIVEGQIDHLLGVDPAPPKLPFTLVRVDL